jgi:hypothetical protein
MTSENNPMMVSLQCGQVIVLLTCWLKKANLFPRGIRKKMFTKHGARDLSGKKYCSLIF